MFEKDQVTKGLPIAILMYIFPILFFLPMVMDDYKTEYCKFHANQALLIFLIYLIGSVLFITIILPILCYIAAVVCIVFGIISALNGSKQPIPLIGGINLINK